MSWNNFAIIAYFGSGDLKQMSLLKRVPLSVLGRLIRFLERDAVGFLRTLYFKISCDANTWRRFAGNWDAASAIGSYQSQNIFESKSDALRSVLTGEAAFERDSVLFTRPEWSTSVLAALFPVMIDRKSEKLRILDFGGGLASLFFQHRSLFDKLNLEWIVVEQKGLVRQVNGQKIPENLKFESSLDDVGDGEFDVCILSSVLQYVPNPEEVIKKVLRYNPRIVLVERTSEREGDTLLAVQRVPENVYKASYPCWIFSADFLDNQLSNKYDRMCKIQSPTGGVYNAFQLSFIDMTTLWVRKSK